MIAQQTNRGNKLYSPAAMYIAAREGRTGKRTPKAAAIRVAKAAAQERLTISHKTFTK